MKVLGVILAVLAIVFAIASGMHVSSNPGGLHEEPESSGCRGGGPGGGRGRPPPPPPTAATNSTS